MFSSHLLAREAVMPEGLATSSGRRDARRFAVYRNNVGVGLTRALERRYPLVMRLVGEEFFRGMARAYVDLERPTSPVLLTYGSGFPAFMASFEPARSVPYLSDIARLEDAMASAFHSRDAGLFTMDALASVPPDSLVTARLTPHPAARLVASPFPIGTIFANHQAEPVRPVKRWAAEAVLITRPDIRCELTVLPAWDVAFAAALLNGAPLGEAAMAAADEPTFDFGRALTALIRLGAFSDDAPIIKENDDA